MAGAGAGNGSSFRARPTGHGQARQQATAAPAVVSISRGRDRVGATPPANGGGPAIPSAVARPVPRAAAAPDPGSAAPLPNFERFGTQHSAASLQSSPVGRVHRCGGLRLRVMAVAEVADHVVLRVRGDEAAVAVRSWPARGCGRDRRRRFRGPAAASGDVEPLVEVERVGDDTGRDRAVGVDFDIPAYGSIDVPIRPAVGRPRRTSPDSQRRTGTTAERIHTNSSAGPTGWFGSQV